MRKIETQKPKLGEDIKKMLSDFSSRFDVYGPKAYGHYLELGRGAWFMNLRGIKKIGIGDPFPPVTYVYGDDLFGKDSTLSSGLKSLVQTYDPNRSYVALFQFDGPNLLTVLVAPQNARFAPRTLYELQNNWPDQLDDVDEANTAA